MGGARARRRKKAAQQRAAQSSPPQPIAVLTPPTEERPPTPPPLRAATPTTTNTNNTAATPTTTNTNTSTSVVTATTPPDPPASYTPPTPRMDESYVARLSDDLVATMESTNSLLQDPTTVLSSRSTTPPSLADRACSSPSEDEAHDVPMSPHLENTAPMGRVGVSVSASFPKKVNHTTPPTNDDTTMDFTYTTPQVTTPPEATNSLLQGPTTVTSFDSTDFHPVRNLQYTTPSNQPTSPPVMPPLGQPTPPTQQPPSHSSFRGVPVQVEHPYQPSTAVPPTAPMSPEPLWTRSSLPSYVPWYTPGYRVHPT